MTGSSRAAADVAEQPDVLARVIASNAEGLSEARALLRDARVVRLAAFGSSKHAAGYGAAALEAFAGLPAVVLPAPGEAVALPEPRGDEPLVVASQSGRTPALLAVAERARNAGVDVIAVTNEAASPLEEVATVTLACHAGAERVVAATKSVTAQCLLMRALAGDVPDEQVDALVDAVREVNALDVGGLVSGDPPAAVVAGGFAAEWFADEIALKLTEMCGLVVTSESVVEHFHGPRASRAPVLALVTSDDPNVRDLSGDVKTAGPSDTFDLRTPTTGDPSLDALVALVVGQVVALAWAAKLGVDPDADRGLSKVTGTR